MRNVTLALLAVLLAIAPGVVDAQEPPPPPPPEGAPVEGAPVETAPVEATSPEAAPPAPEPPEPETVLEIYGFVMFDGGYQFGQNDPAWFDVLRPTKLPSFEDEFAPSGRTFMSVRQTRFGVKGTFPTDMGDVKTQFEWELFGVGADAGQTTIRLRHAYGELGQFGAGQTWSPFMDIDVFPNTVEYWGPPGMVFFRNVQVRWMPIQGDTRMTVALERPGASADQGIYAERVELEDAVAHFPAPDLSAEFRLGGDWGYVELAGILRWMEWDDLGAQPGDISGNAVGWGLNLSSNLKLARHTVRLQGVVGAGIQNYMNDAPADVAIDGGEGVAVPLLGLVAFIDLQLGDELTSSLGYSFVGVDNTDGQDPAAFAAGHYAIANLLATPVKNYLVGAELQYGRRENNSDGWSYDDFRVQVTFKYSFSRKVGE